MKISLVIPTHNRKNELERALKSVCKGSVKPHEIIVIDDGSTDDTKDVTNLFDVRYFYQENRGVSSARNSGIKIAQYEWIALLDSDDEWHRDKLAKQIAFHKQNPHILCSQSNEIWKLKGVFKNQPKRYNKPQGNIFEQLLEVCCVSASSFMTHRSVFDTVGLFDESLLACEDHDLFLQIATKYEFGLLEDPLIIKHAGASNQLSFTTPLIDRYRVKMLQKHNTNPQAKKALIHRCNILLKGAQKNKNHEVEAFVEDIFRAL
jgi:glycosyltransferase involved in cell wall biosynthesis